MLDAEEDTDDDEICLSLDLLVKLSFYLCLI